MQNDVPDQQVGDKVRIKTGDHKGKRGLITLASIDNIEVELNDGNTVVVNQDKITNFSLAARKAWKVMPKRSGRPRSATARKKQVTMRIDSETWQMLGQAVEQGFLTSREMMVNQVVKRGLIDLLKTNKELLTPEIMIWLTQEDDNS